jgi:hypothetical protein
MRHNILVAVLQAVLYIMICGDAAVPKFSPNWLAVVPELKIAACLISKNSWTASTSFLLRAAGKSDWQRPLWLGAHVGNVSAKLESYRFTRSLLSINELSPARKVEALTSPMWTRVVLIREPLSRFISAYLDKCHRKPLFDWSCPVRYNASADRPMGSHGGSLREVVEHVEESLARPDSYFRVDQHWQPQVAHCNLSNASIRAAFRPIPFDRLKDGWVKVLSSARGIPAHRRQQLVRWASETFRSDDEAHVKLHHPTSSSELVASLIEAAASTSHADRDIAPRIRAMYKIDYDAFFPESATGRRL